MKNNLKIYRAKNNLTQSQLSKKVNVSRQTINYIENGKYIPSVLLALKISKVLNCSVKDIFYMEDDKNEK